MRSYLAAALIAAATLTGCQTVYHGHLDDSRHEAGVSLRRIVLLPLENATSDPAAARALRDFTASALAEHGLRFTQTEADLILLTKKNSPTETGLYPELAAKTGARYFITGAVHEYRYMSDLEGSPAIGYTLRLVDARDGRTLWTGTAANTGYGWQSLSELCADSARRLVREIPLVMRDESAEPRVCVRTGKPAYYTPTGKPDTYEVDTQDGTLSYTVIIPEEQFPPLHTTAPRPPAPPAEPAPAESTIAPAHSPVPASMGGSAPVIVAAPIPVPAPIASPAPVATPAGDQ